jgi:hypothetical protein
MVDCPSHFSLNQAAEALQVSAQTLSDQHARGRIAAFRDPSGALRFIGTAIKAFEARHIHPSGEQYELDVKAGFIDQSLRRWWDDCDAGHIADIAESAVWICVKRLGRERTSGLLAVALERADEASR